MYSWKTRIVTYKFDMLLRLEMLKRMFWMLMYKNRKNANQAHNFAKSKKNWQRTEVLTHPVCLSCFSATAVKRQTCNRRSKEVSHLKKFHTSYFCREIGFYDPIFNNAQSCE